jgi:UDP-N-acetylglucosamine--N-acetylmuramyl-(pentapeptide) pyrophosphoryl-undecaprenol N-acetylglucosamine transferase
MILITCGSSHLPFDRLVTAAAALDTDERLVVQHGPSAVRVPSATNVDFVPMAELTRLIDEARVVVTHAGVGSILVALSHGKRPVVVPRRGSSAEAVDDHQLECARRFSRAGLVTLVEDPATLSTELESHEGSQIAPVDDARPLERELSAYIREAVGA